MLVGMLAAGAMLSLGAQSARVDMNFGKITCTKLAVVDADGKEGVSLSNSRRGEEIFVWGKHSYVWVANNEHGGMSACWAKMAVVCSCPTMSTAGLSRCIAQAPGRGILRWRANGSMTKMTSLIS